MLSLTFLEYQRVLNPGACSHVGTLGGILRVKAPGVWRPPGRGRSLVTKKGRDNHDININYVSFLP